LLYTFQLYAASPYSQLRWIIPNHDPISLEETLLLQKFVFCTITIISQYLNEESNSVER